MNTAPTDELEDRLSEQMQRLAADLPTPMVPAEADLARGRRRLRRQRLAAVGGGAATLAVIGVVGALTVGPTAGGTAVQHVRPASDGASLTSPHSFSKRDRTAELRERAAKRKADANGNRGSAKARSHRSHSGVPASSGISARLNRFRTAVADVLDPHGLHLDAKVTNQQVASGRSGLAALGTKLGWKDSEGLGEIMVTVSRTAADTGAFSTYSCAPGDTGGHACTPVTLSDGTTGQQQRYGDTLAVSHTRPDGQVVLVAESALFGNNSTVPVSALPASAKQLLRVATDPRLTLGR